MNLSFESMTFAFILLYIVSDYVRCVTSRESVWGLRLTEKDGGFNLMPNYMYENSFITVTGSCESDAKDALVEIQWVLLEIDCMEEMYKSSTKAVYGMFDLLSNDLANLGRNNSGHGRYAFPAGLGSVNGSENRPVTFYVQFSQRQKAMCSHKQILELKDESSSPYVEATGTTDAITKLSRGDFHVLRKIHRNNQTNTNKVYNRVATAWSDGMFHFFLNVVPVTNITFNVTVFVEMRGHYGYLSAIEWPLLPITGIMSVLYLFAGTMWIILWAKSQENSLKIHIVIGAAAVAGAMGNTLVFIDLSVRNTDGVGASLVQWIGKLISIIQLCLTQLLLMTVSTGYGINRPTVSRLFVQVMVSLSAMSFFVNTGLAIVQSESLKIKYEQSWLVTLTLIIYSVVMLVVAGWIMAFSIYTFIYLFQRRHSSQRKLIIFSVFMTCCITAFAVYIGVSAYTLASNGLFSDCLKNWKHEWLAATVSQVQMFALLVVLMWLWRPIDDNASGESYHPLSIDEDRPEENSEEEKDGKLVMESINM